MYRFKRLNESQAENIQIKTHHKLLKTSDKRVTKRRQKERHITYTEQRRECSQTSCQEQCKLEDKENVFL